VIREIYEDSILVKFDAFGALSPEEFDCVIDDWLKERNINAKLKLTYFEGWLLIYVWTIKNVSDRMIFKLAWTNKIWN
jgi:hypothetical protein